MKTQKLEEVPQISAAHAADILGRAADAQDVDHRVQQRIATVQDLLADDLSWIESALAAAVDEGPLPATLAAGHLVKRGGKRVRPMALLLSAACSEGSRLRFGSWRSSPNLSIRRPCSTMTWWTRGWNGAEHRPRGSLGETRSACSVVICSSCTPCRGLNNHAPEIMPDLIATLRRLVDGEIIQLRGRTELDVSEATYERILRDKTASLFAWSTRTGARMAGASAEDQERLAAFGERLGIAFQLVDDVLDYSGAESGKTLLTDLREGKLTLPLVLAVARMPELVQPLQRIYAGDLEPVTLVSRAVVASGACEEVRRRASDHTRSAVEALRSVKPGPARVLLEGVAQQLAARAA